MSDLISILKDAGANVKIEVNGEDLLEFSNELINRAKSELSSLETAARGEKYLTKKEVRQMCEVCDATLWHWNRKGYLKAIKVGNKVRYKLSDVQRILDGSAGFTPPRKT